MKAIVKALAKSSETLAGLLFAGVLFVLKMALAFTAAKDPSFKKRLGEKNLTVQIRLKDKSQGRYYTLKDGKILSRSGLHTAPDVVIVFGSAMVALDMLVPPRDQLATINAMKNFQLGMEGPEELTWWWMETLSLMMNAGMAYGTKVSPGVMRYTSNTNGGPVFVYVKEGKILRITPIDFEEKDAPPWTIHARGKTFTPPHRATVSPHTLVFKSMIYSPDRLLYPMKRVDFNPDGERNCQNRGVSGYVRIGWDEALDIVAGEIKRVKKDHGPGAIMNGSGSHHLWGVLGYWLSARLRFFNHIGWTPVVHNPDSWEGWYWGAMHHWGQSMHLGAPESYGTVEDCLKECEMVVFWSSDPEATSGVYAAFEGTVRRQWLKELGIPMVHIDPFYNHTAALLGGKWLAPRPATGNALALAIAYVWITEDLYDKPYVAQRTQGFDAWKDYILGKEDGIPKTPEWQEGEAGIPARDVRALARQWGTKKTYLAAGGLSGFGGACRCATGNEWARAMVCLMAMQGLGKPGVNMGGMQQGTPIDTGFYFPGYAEGGLSGDIAKTALGVSLYNRCPQLPTVNTVYQQVPRLHIPEAILDGHTTGYPTDATTIEGQFLKFEYPTPGYSPVRMYYKYGGSHIGTMADTNRYVKAYRSENLEFVVNQSIWFEGEAKFADIILPACTSFERWDISEFANCGGYIQHSFNQCNHRVRPDAAQVHRTPGRIEIRLPDLPGDRQAPRFFRDVLRGGHGNRLVQASVRCHGSAEGHLLEGVPEEGLLCRPGAQGRYAGSSFVPRLCGGQAEGHAGNRPPARRLHGAGVQGASDPIGKAGVRLLQPGAVRPRRSGAAGHDQVHPLLGGTSHDRSLPEVPAAADHPAPAVQLPHHGRRQTQLGQRDRGPSGPDRRLPLLDRPDQRQGRGDAGHQGSRPGQGVQRPGGGDLRGAAHAAGPSRDGALLRVLGGL